MVIAYIVSFVIFILIPIVVFVGIATAIGNRISRGNKQSHSNSHPYTDAGKITDNKSHTPTQNSNYAYRPKLSILTKTEQIFLVNLRAALVNNVEIIPQAHISSILDHEVPGQSYKGAFAKINGKSVDFLVCTKNTYIPILAIELDDASHNRYDRVERDKFVNNAFKQAGIPLVRISRGEWESVGRLKSKLQKSIPSLQQSTPQP